MNLRISEKKFWRQPILTLQEKIIQKLDRRLKAAEMLFAGILPFSASQYSQKNKKELKKKEKRLKAAEMLFAGIVSF